MVDVPNIPPIQGPGAPHPSAKKPERSVDADKFQKEMHKKVEKVSETDQEQKKKRKRKEESEEEEEPKAAQGPSIPPEQVTPFSLAEEKKKASPLSMQKGGEISPLASAQPSTTRGAPPPIAPPAPLMATPSTDEMEDDSGLLEESAFIETMPTEEAPSPVPLSSEPSAKEAPPSPTPPYVEGRLPEETSKQQPPQKEEEPSDETKEQTKQTSKIGPPAPTVRPAKAERAKKAEELPLPPKSAPAKEVTISPEVGKKGVSTQELEKMKKTAMPEETSGFFEQFVEDKEKGLKKEIKPKESEAGRLGIEEPAPITPLPSSNSLEKEKKKDEELLSIGPLTPMPEISALTPLTEASSPINPYANLHPHVMDLFDKMVGVMSVMTTSGIKETVMTLNAPKFASSVFFGSQIIIQEYTSAPHAFNIQINGTPQALALFQGNADDLMAAFQYGNYNFRVNRLETGLLTERHQVRRKEPPSGGQDQKGSKK